MWARFSASGDPTNFWFRTLGWDGIWVDQRRRSHPALVLCFGEHVYAPADRIWAHHALVEEFLVNLLDFERFFNTAPNVMPNHQAR